MYLLWVSKDMSVSMVSYEACRSPKGLRCSVLVSKQASQSPIMHVGLRWVSHQACWSPIRHVSLRWVSDEACRSPMRHVGLRWVFNEACWSPTGLQSGMLVSNGSLICIRWVSDRSSIIIIFL